MLVLKKHPINVALRFILPYCVLWLREGTGDICPGGGGVGGGELLTYLIRVLSFVHGLKNSVFFFPCRNTKTPLHLTVQETQHGHPKLKIREVFGILYY